MPLGRSKSHDDERIEIASDGSAPNENEFQPLLGVGAGPHAHYGQASIDVHGQHTHSHQHPAGSVSQMTPNVSEALGPQQTRPPGAATTGIASSTNALTRGLSKVPALLSGGSTSSATKGSDGASNTGKGSSSKGKDPTAVTNPFTGKVGTSSAGLHLAQAKRKELKESKVVVLPSRTKSTTTVTPAGASASATAPSGQLSPAAPATITTTTASTHQSNTQATASQPKRRSSESGGAAVRSSDPGPGQGPDRAAAEITSSAKLPEKSSKATKKARQPSPSHHGAFEHEYTQPAKRRTRYEESEDEYTAEYEENEGVEDEDVSWRDMGKDIPYGTNGKDDSSSDSRDEQQQHLASQPSGGVVAELESGRVTVYSTAKAYRLPKLKEHLREKYKRYEYRLHGSPQIFQEAMYAHYVLPVSTAGQDPVGEIFYFDYGCVVMWGLSEVQEREVLYELQPYEQKKLEKEEVQFDEFDFVYAESEQPRISNDVITLNTKHDYQLKMAISYAMSQSTKLFVFEETISDLIELTQHVPADLARTGAINLTRKQVAKRIGYLFTQMCAINLVSNVLDTPDFLWEEPDELQDLYMAVRSYLDIKKRVDVLNQRLMVVHGILGMLKDEQDNIHSEKLEWIVIWLIVAEIVVGVIGIFVEAIFH
eukprot:Clim_evm10s20 gene=Clim_evmTU10s20